MSLQRYFHAHDQVARWKAERENATSRLENARIIERFYEIECQAEPLASLIAQKGSEREAIVAAAHYVVFGRMPSTEELKP